MKSLQDYTVVIRPNDNNTFIAYVPAIQGCHAWGETSEAARAELNHVFSMILEEYQEWGVLCLKMLNLIDFDNSVKKSDLHF